MIDITKCKQIFYGDSQSVTVFQDHADPKTWYMVPVPRLRGTSKDPEFSLTRYKNVSGEVTGVCTFQIELYTPDDARKAAEKVLGDVVWGQWTWVGGDSMFTYDIEGNPESVVVSPTLFGANVACYQIPLKSEAALRTFISAFSGDGQYSPFQVDYQMEVLTELLGASATVKYDSTVAIDYERRYEKRSTTWGTETVLAEVKQVLKQSGAGDVKVEKGAGGTDELVQRVRDWAWSTLEQEVAANVSTAQSMAKGTSPVSASTSFTRSYQENTVVKWSTPVTALLPKFDADTWKKVYREVDNRELAIGFVLAGELFTKDGKPAFQNVEVTVDYPTRLQGNTFSLVPGKDEQAAKQYVAPGNLVGGKFDPNYRYKYEVHYGSGLPYQSPWVSTSDTRIELRPADFGLSQVRFLGTDIPFVGSKRGRLAASTSIKKVFIDFFFQPPANQKALVQTQEMISNGEEGAVTFVSKYNAPVGQEYSYRLRYLVDGGKEIVIEPGPCFGGNNADVVEVLDPSKMVSVFNLRATNLEETSFQLIEVNGQYFDQQNSGSKPLASHDWSWEPKSGKGVQTAPDPWSFQVVPNPGTSFFKLDGQFIFEDGSSFLLDQLHSPGNLRSLNLFSDSLFYSVRIDVSKIDWTKVSAVYVNLFQTEAELWAAHGEATPPAFFLKPRLSLSRTEQRDAEAQRVNYQRFDVLAPADGQSKDAFARYYNIRCPRTAAQVDFWYNADYVLADGTTKTIPNDEVKDKLQIILPPVPTGATPKPLQRHLTRDDLTSLRARRS